MHCAHVSAFNLLVRLFVNNDRKQKQESRAVARKPRDAAAVLFGLKFADDIRYRSLKVAKLRKPGFRAPNIPVQNRI